MTHGSSDETTTYDVVVIGGALSGAATVTLLLRQNPGLRLLIVEKSAKLTRRVGEATVEVSAYFIGRVLGPRALLTPPFSVPMSRPVFHLMRTYNRRFAQVARRRRRVNALGKTNRGMRCLIPGFTLKGGDFQGLFGALATWARIELTEGWRSWWQRPAACGSAPSPSASPVPAAG